MSTISIEMLTPDRVTELWPILADMFQAACEGNEIAKDEMDAEDIRQLAESGMCAIFVGAVDDEPTCILALQFNITNGMKGADILALAGKHLLQFKSAYWELILEWLRANEIEFLDAYIPESRINMYKKKFGFNKSCGYVRMNLH